MFYTLVFLYIIFILIDINNGECMKIRLGYVSISNALDISASRAYTYSEYLKNQDIRRLDTVIKDNLNNLKQIMIYNIKNNIHFYRMTSKLIPLATKEDVIFDYLDQYNEYYNSISKIIKNYNLRVDMHPNEYCVLNSTSTDIVNSSIEIIKYHYNILDKLGINDKVIILHISSSVFGKEKSIQRFINSFNKLEDNIKKSIVLENDDKIYNVKDTLSLCKKLNIRMVLDYHHHLCNNCGNIDEYLEEILNTWNTIPKMHYSSPKNRSKKEYRSHNDYINPYEFIEFINILKKYNRDIDIMLEAKMKDDALFRLIRQLKYLTDYKFIDETSFIV